MRIFQNYIVKVINEEWNVRNTDSTRTDIRNSIKN